MSYNKINLLDFPDCAALSEYGKCSWLAVQNCQGNNCPFRRTKKDYLMSVKFSYDRLSELDKIQQLYIAKKYYGGSMPWNEK